MARENINDKNKVRTGFYSIKNQTHGLPDSYLEQLMALTLEFDSSVVKYKIHPVQTHFTDEKGKPRKYKPDIAVLFNSEIAKFVEVKPFFRTQNPFFKLRMELLNRHFIERFKAPLIVLTEKNLNLNQVKNYQRLYAFKRKPLNDCAYDLLERLDSDSVLFSDLKSINSSMGFRPHIPFSILAHQKFVYDYTKTLESNTLLKAA